MRHKTMPCGRTGDLKPVRLQRELLKITGEWYKAIPFFFLRQFPGRQINMISFKERVKNAAVSNAVPYKETFIDYEYLICSPAFQNGYHIIKSDKGNYLHLIGVHTRLSPKDFFEKCLNGTLQEDDFDFANSRSSEKSLKGSVREKIISIPLMMDMFSMNLFAEDNLKHNKIECAFATADSRFTVGFAVSGRPKSLLKGNKLNKAKAQKVSFIFRKKRDEGELFGELIYGETADIRFCSDKIKSLLTPSLQRDSAIRQSPPHNQSHIPEITSKSLSNRNASQFPTIRSMDRRLSSECSTSLEYL